MSGKPVSDKYVILQNTSTSPKVITDHRGTLQQMKRGEYVKIYITEEGEQLAFRKYNGMKSIPGLLVTFSSNVKIEDHIDKITVRSNKDISEETAKKVDIVRKSIQINEKAKHMGAAHLQRVKAEQALKAKGTHIGPTQSTMPQEPDLDEEIEEGPGIVEKPAPKREAKNSPAVKAKAKVKEPEPEDEEETGLTADVDAVLEEAAEEIGDVPPVGAGIALTEENLMGMTKAAVIDVAKQLDMDIDESVDKKDIVKAILKKVV